MRKKFIAGNWKMFTSSASAVELARAVVAGLGAEEGVRVAVCPPFPYLALAADALKGSRVSLGGQNLYPREEGAFTGEVSPRMLLDVGCRFVILGHSERRHILNEPDSFVNEKVHSALQAGLEVILCVGETIEQRQTNQTESVLDRQLASGLANVAEADLARITIAYEPVWAIGTGHNATPDQAEQAHAFLRRRIAEIYSEKCADEVPIQYGGSVKPDNAASLLSQANVDGALVGGASLKAGDFLKIIQAAAG